MCPRCSSASSASNGPAKNGAVSVSRKVCGTWGEEKPADAFLPSKFLPVGLTDRCKPRLRGQPSRFRREMAGGKQLRGPSEGPGQLRVTARRYRKASRLPGAQLQDPQGRRRPACELASRSRHRRSGPAGQGTRMKILNAAVELLARAK
jgi:hypothetical protein